MIMISPITPANFTTSVTENDYPEYSQAQTYNQGDKVIISSLHNVYESLINNNLNADPTSAALNWELIGAVNAYLGLDNKNSSQSVAVNQIVFEFDVQKAIAICLLNVQAQSIKVEIIQDGITVWENSVPAISRNSSGWYSYFFGDFNFIKNFYFPHILCPLGRYRVTLTGDVCKYGSVVAGTTTEIGYLLADKSATNGFIDYSKYIDNTFGDIELIQGSIRDTYACNVAIRFRNFRRVLETIKSRRGQLTLYLQPSLGIFLYGFAKEPQLIEPDGDYSISALTINTIN